MAGMLYKIYQFILLQLLSEKIENMRKNNMKKYKFILIIAIIFLVFVGAGCASNKKDKVSNSTTAPANSNSHSNISNLKSATSINNVPYQVKLDGIGTFTVLSSTPPVGTEEEINKWCLYSKEVANYTNGTKDYVFGLSLKANSLSDMEGKGFRIQIPNNEVVSLENIHISQKSNYHELSANCTGRLGPATFRIGDNIMTNFEFGDNLILRVSPQDPIGSGPYTFYVNGNFNLSGK
jgi:hypothetical protein